jgi:hypothetical protein
MNTLLRHGTVGLVLEDGSFVPVQGNLSIGRSPHCQAVLRLRPARPVAMRNYSAETGSCTLGH